MKISKVDHILEHKAIFLKKKYKETISSILSGHKSTGETVVHTQTNEH